MAELKMNKNYPRTIYNGPGDEIVITGISGRYPNSLDLQQLEYNLYNKIDMIDDDERRWRHDNPEIPKRGGKIDNLEKFDATFFGIHANQANAMDPQARVLTEKAYEAILDAGISPKSLRGTRTGVFIGVSNCESEKEFLYEKSTSGGFGITGCCRSLIPNRISYILGLQGPSLLVDTACSTSFYAMDAAFTSMRIGECDAALVGATHLTLHPNITLQLARTGVLSPEGMSRPFDADASGFVRSEAISIIVLQKSRDAKRIYGTVVYSKTNCDGYKEEGITFPSAVMQAQLLAEFYKEINIQPETVNYIEAHGTGTIVGDPEECNALDEVFCKHRKIPMAVGSIKSNLGHTEAASGMCSIAKCILAMENQLIPPNINFSKIRPGIKSLEENRLQVVHNTQKLDGPLIAINSFGFGGANAHCLLRAHAKDKINGGAPKDTISRLVNWSGRTEEACNVIHEALASQPLDAEFIGLLHNAQRDSVSGNVFKSFGLYKHIESNNAECVTKEVQHFNGIKRPIVYVFSGMGSQWSEMGTALLELPIFRDTIQKCHDLLKPKGLDLLNIITSPDKNMFDNIVHSFVGIASIQAALCDCLTALNIQPDYIIGHSTGELACAYADNCLTLEQTMLCAYSRGIACLEMTQIEGSMAAIGLSYNKIKNRVPPTIDVACHNGTESCTISGPQNEVEKFVAELTSDGIFALEVACCNMAFHSRYLTFMAPKLLQYLLEIIKVPNKRSKKWLSTSSPQNKWDLPESQYCSAQYQTNNFVNPVLFEETLLLLPHDAVLIEVAPHGFFQSILRKSLSNAIYIPLTQRGNKRSLDFFLTALGKIYLNGIDMAIDNLYPKVEFPVSRGTPRLSHLIKWDHSEDWFVMKYNVDKPNSGGTIFSVSLQGHDYGYISGHLIDGRCIFPATGYLTLVWDTFAGIEGKLFSKVNVQFEDVKYLLAVPITDQESAEFLVTIHLASGRFELTEKCEAIVTGYIKELPCNKQLTNLPPLIASDEHPYLPAKDFYKELRLRGYHYDGIFRDVIEARSDGLHGRVRWNSNWVAFMNCMLQISFIGKETRRLLLPKAIEKLTIDTAQHEKFLNKFDPEKPETHFMEVFANKNLRIYQAGGIEIKGIEASPIERRKVPSVPVLEVYKFIPCMPTPKMTEINAARICVQHAVENHSKLRITCVELLNKKDLPFIIKMKEAIEDLPLITGDFKILTSEPIEYDDILVEDGSLSSKSNYLFVIKPNCLTDSVFLERSKVSLLEHGYIISREPANLEPNQIIIPQGFNLVVVIPLDNETLVILQKKIQKLPKEAIIIEISLADKEFKWLEQLKTDIEENEIIVYSQNEPLSGIIGFVNCLHKEPNGTNVTCVFVDDPTAPPFAPKHPFYKNQLELNLAINVYRNGQWGSYRHLVFDKWIRNGPTDIHAIANITRKGDLSSVRWYNGSFNQRFADNQTKIQFAALNCRDFILETGKLPTDIYGESRLDEDCANGLEYSGIDMNGTRIMGLVKSGAISTHIVTDPELTWTCPNNWSLEQAASVPVAYGTVYTALFLHGHIKKGNSILIHNGAVSMGLAAIRVALAYGLNVFTTASTKETREYLLETFPELKDSHIGDLSDTSFEDMIQIQTNGVGVDFVLGTLTEDKRQASLRCLGKCGIFLEIGRYDNSRNDIEIGLREFSKQISFHTVYLDVLFASSLQQKNNFQMMIKRDIDSGIIKPLPTTVYPANEIEAAFRSLASGKHFGKVLIKIREDPFDRASLPIEMYPRFNCENDVSYIVIGGLGGLGLELVDWLIIRGARKLVISSRTGITKPYQTYRIKIWESYGATIKINISNVGTLGGCEIILKEAIQLGPVAGIFNLGMVLQDALLENQTIEKYNQCLFPKANITICLDKLSRKLCPALTHFVVFSSYCCGRGYASQTNYGMANSIMERIIEQRHLQNLPGKAIQFAAVGEVGLVSDMQGDKLDITIAGTIPQRLSAWLEGLDSLLTGGNPVVANMVVAEKRTKAFNRDAVVPHIMRMMSIRDIKSISMHSTLADLGMDSHMAVEIKHTLESDFDIFVPLENVRKLTFAKLDELKDQDKQSSEDEA